MWTEAQQQAFAEQGYFTASDAVSPDMVEELRQAARRVKGRVRTGELDLYTDYRGEGEPYHVSGLIAPQYGEPIFAQYLASEPLLSYVQAQIGRELRLGSLSMFTNPHDQVFNVPWHRDDGLVFDKDEATELAYLQEPRTECRWELSLADDSALGVIPGSQKRYRTHREWEAMSNSRAEDLPGAETIHLRAGETVFWNGNIIHRACHRPDRERLTLVAAYKAYRADESPQDVGRFQFLLDDEVRTSLPTALHVYYDRWKSLQLA